MLRPKPSKREKRTDEGATPKQLSHTTTKTTPRMMPGNNSKTGKKKNKNIQKRNYFGHDEV